MELTEMLFTLLVSGLLVPVLQFVQRIWKLSGVGMLWASVLASLAVSIAISIFTKDGGFGALLTNPIQILTGTGTIFATANILYRTLRDKLGLVHGVEVILKGGN
jgi:hypothetical protein